MQHRGEIVKNFVYQSGMSITMIASRLGKSRRWMYQMFENSNISLDIIIQIGEIIHHDFSEEINELKSAKFSLNDKKSPYGLNLNEDTQFWKNKYLNLLEEYNELLKRLEST
jgi:predicted transcriptional regulator